MEGPEGSARLTRGQKAVGILQADAIFQLILFPNAALGSRAQEWRWLPSGPGWGAAGRDSSQAGLRGRARGRGHRRRDQEASNLM